MDVFSLSIILFLIIDPFGNIGSYLQLTKSNTPRRRSFILIREMLIALAVMLLFSLIGEYIFNILHISERTVRLASGVILFLFGVKILFPTIDSPRSNLPEGEPFIVPLAIPLIAGPSLLATIMLFSHIVPSVLTMVLAILIAWFFSTLTLLSGPFLQRKVGSSGLIAAERLMGMILVLIAIQRFLEGVQQFVDLCKLT
jgi:multiple antibiotic resistance protein